MACSSIWESALEDDVQGTVRKLILTGDRKEFEAVTAQLGLSPTQPEELAASFEDRIKELEKAYAHLPPATRQQLIETMRDAFRNGDDESDGWGDDEFTEGAVCEDLLPSLESTELATSRLFFDSLWEYEQIALQVDGKRRTYADAISAELGQQPVTLDEAFGISLENLFESDGGEIWDSPILYQLGEAIVLWPLAERTYFLAHQQEDKELPISIVFGRFGNQDHARLGKHLRSLK